MTFPCRDFFKINYVRQKSSFTVLVVVNLPAQVCHVIVLDYLHLSFDVILTIVTVELLPLPDMIQTFLNVTVPLQVFIHNFSIGEV